MLFQYRLRFCSLKGSIALIVVKVHAQVFRQCSWSKLTVLHIRLRKSTTTYRFNVEVGMMNNHLVTPESVVRPLKS